MNGIIARLLIVVGVLAVAVGSGYRYRGVQCDTQAAIIEASQRAITQANALSKQDAEVSAQYEKARVEQRTVYKTLTSERIKYVESHPDVKPCGLDADGLRLWNAANAGDLHADPGQSADAPGGVAPGEKRAAP